MMDWIEILGPVTGLAGLIYGMWRCGQLDWLPWPESVEDRENGAFDAEIARSKDVQALPKTQLASSRLFATTQAEYDRTDMEMRYRRVLERKTGMILHGVPMKSWRDERRRRHVVELDGWLTTWVDDIELELA